MPAEDPIATAERRLRDYGGYLDLYPARCRWTGLVLACSLSLNLLVVYALWSAYAAR